MFNKEYFTYSSSEDHIMADRTNTNTKRLKGCERVGKIEREFVFVCLPEPEHVLVVITEDEIVLRRQPYPLRHVHIIRLIDKVKMRKD